MRPQDYGILPARFSDGGHFLEELVHLLAQAVDALREFLLHGWVLILPVGLEQVLKLIALGQELIGGLSEIVYPLE